MLKNKKPLFIVGYVIAIAAVIFSLITLYGQYTLAPEEGDNGEVSLLYVQTAHSGTLSAPGSDNIRTLTLSNVSPTTVFFSDRPDRETGHTAIEQFIEEWDDGDDSFSNDPPNAALDILGDDSQSIINLELMNPVYDVDTKTLQYDVIILEESDTGISQYGEERDYSVLQSFGEAALFIDSSYKSYHCRCEPSVGQKTCICNYKYTLGKSLTKEFIGFCTQNVAYPSGLSVTGLEKSTTCTVRVFDEPHVSRSCTNWNTKSRDELDVAVHCTKH